MGISESRIGQREELSKDVVSAGDQLEPGWFYWKLWSMNFSSLSSVTMGCCPLELL